jgi:hypothetical protein
MIRVDEILINLAALDPSSQCIHYNVAVDLHFYWLLVRNYLLISPILLINELIISIYGTIKRNEQSRLPDNHSLSILRRH